MKKTKFTDFLTKAEFLWIRKNTREQLCKIVDEIRFLRKHRKYEAAKKLKESGLYPDYFNYSLLLMSYRAQQYMARNPHDLIAFYKRELRHKARKLNLILIALNGTLLPEWTSAERVLRLIHSEKKRAELVLGEALEVHNA